MTPALRSRLFVVVLLLLAGRVAVAERPVVRTPLGQPLTAFPLALDGWQGIEAEAFDKDTLKVLGADDYVNRIYHAPGGAPLGLFVGYYASQEQGDAIHSPQNCLPGNGWTPIARSRETMNVDGREIRVNRYVVEKRGDRQLVLYWFQGRGRIVASEYVNKAYLLHDGLRFGRTHGALVRIIVPVVHEEASADAVAQAFARAALPVLTRWLP